MVPGNILPVLPSSRCWLCGKVQIGNLTALVSLYAGLIALGVTTAIFGTVAAYNHKKFKDQPIEIAKEDLENV